MLRRLLQPIWILLAVVFLIEAWLWDHLEPIVARVVEQIPLRAFKQWLAERDGWHQHTYCVDRVGEPHWISTRQIHWIDHCDFPDSQSDSAGRA